MGPCGTQLASQRMGPGPTWILDPSAGEAVMLADPGADRTKVTARLLIREHRRVWDLSREGRKEGGAVVWMLPSPGAHGIQTQPQASCVAWRKPWLCPFPIPGFSGETPLRAGRAGIERGWDRKEPSAWDSSDAISEEMGSPNLYLRP